MNEAAGMPSDAAPGGLIPIGIPPSGAAASTLGLEPGSWAKGFPDGIEPPGRDVVAGAAWAPFAGRPENRLYVITWGSSSCPVLAEPLATITDGEIVIDLKEPAPGPCTRDLAPTTSVVEVPNGYASDPTMVRIGNLGTVEIADRGSQTGDLRPPGVGSFNGPASWIDASE